MKKNININIGGIIFHIEEDGHRKLKKYLETMQRSVATYNKRFEIMACIENRIAETFLNKLKDGIQVVTVEDVEDLMGTKEGFFPFNNIKNTNYVYLF
jgi:hypothetical protein